MVAADGQGRHAGRNYLGKEGLNVLDALLQAVAAAKRHVADVGELDLGQGRQAVDVMVGADPLDAAHGARSQPRARPVGDAQIHRHADQGRVEAAEIGQLRRIEPKRRAQKRRYAFVGFRSPVGPTEDQVKDLLELRIVDLAWRTILVFGAQFLELISSPCSSLTLLARGVSLGTATYIFTDCYP